MQSQAGRAGSTTAAVDPCCCCLCQSQWDRDKDTGFWGSHYVISPRPLARKERGFFCFVLFCFKRETKATQHGLLWVCFPYFSTPWTSISENQARFERVTWLGSLQSYVSAKLFFIFLLHFVQLKHG